MSGTQINDKSAVVANNTNNKQRRQRRQRQQQRERRQPRREPNESRVITAERLSHSPTHSLVSTLPARPSGQLVGCHDKRGSCLGAQQSQQREMQPESSVCGKRDDERERERERARELKVEIDSSRQQQERACVRRVATALGGCCRKHFQRLWKRCLALFPATCNGERGRARTYSSRSRCCARSLSLSLAAKKREKVQQMVWLNTEAVTETQGSPAARSLSLSLSRTHPKCHPLFSNDTKLCEGGELGRGGSVLCWFCCV